MNEFKKQLKELESSGWEFSGHVACASVGGDHDCEIYTNPENKDVQKYVCKTCGTIEG